VTPPIPVARNSPEVVGEVVTVPSVVFDDADAEHADPEQDWIPFEILKGAGGGEVIPGLVAASVYAPGWSTDKLENEATPPLALTVVVPDSEPEPWLGPRATVTVAAELVSRLPEASRTATVTGPPVELNAEVITELAAAVAGGPVNASEHDPAGVPERFPALAGSSWKSLPVPLKLFDCLAATPHWYVPPLHAAAALTVNVAEAPGATDSWAKSAELDVKLIDPGAPVITKPAGAEICTEPSIWVDASLETVNANATLAPAAGLDDDTATAKHLPDAMHVLEVAPADGAVSIAVPSKPAASTPIDTRAILKSSVRIDPPLSCVNRWA
jgi:hypothetical protein